MDPLQTFPSPLTLQSPQESRNIAQQCATQKLARKFLFCCKAIFVLDLVERQVPIFVVVSMCGDPFRKPSYHVIFVNVAGLQIIRLTS